MANLSGGEALAGSEGAGRRAEMQDWTLLGYYLTPQVWDILQSPERHLKKVDVVCQHLVNLGLRNPSERSMATLAALVGHGSPEMQQAERQISLLATVKSVLKTQITRAKQMQIALPPGGFLKDLPYSGSDLPAGFLEFCFPNGFTRPPFDLELVAQAARVWPMRSTHRSMALVSNLRHGTVLPSPAVHPLQSVLQNWSTSQSLFEFLGMGSQLPPGFRFCGPGHPASGSKDPPPQPGASRLATLLHRAESSGVESDASGSGGPAGVVGTPLAIEDDRNHAQQPAQVVAEPVGPASLPDVGPPPQVPADIAPLEEAADVGAMDAHLQQLAQAHYEKALPALDPAAASEREAKKKAQHRRRRR